MQGLYLKTACLHTVMTNLSEVRSWVLILQWINRERQAPEGASTQSGKREGQQQGRQEAFEQCYLSYAILHGAFMVDGFFFVKKKKIQIEISTLNTVICNTHNTEINMPLGIQETYNNIKRCDRNHIQYILCIISVFTIEAD